MQQIGIPLTQKVPYKHQTCLSTNRVWSQIVLTLDTSVLGKKTIYYKVYNRNMDMNTFKLFPSSVIVLKICIYCSHTGFVVHIGSIVNLLSQPAMLIHWKTVRYSAASLWGYIKMKCAKRRKVLCLSHVILVSNLLTFGTAAWKTKSVMSASVELDAWMVMTAMFGLGLALSNVKSIFRPFLLYAVIGGIPIHRFQGRRWWIDLQIWPVTFYKMDYANPRKQKLNVQDLNYIRNITQTTLYLAVDGWSKGTTDSPAAAMSLNMGCEERPSKRKGGWEVGTEGAGAGAGPPRKRRATHQGLRRHRHI